MLIEHYALASVYFRSNICFRNYKSELSMFQYAGLVQDIRGDIDPSGRTGLLKILDQAKVSLITSLSFFFIHLMQYLFVFIIFF